MRKPFLLVAFLASVAGAARADDDEVRARARALMQEGNAKFDADLFVEALDPYQRAYALVPTSNLDFTLAQTLNELGRSVEALEHYERYVRAVKATDNPEWWKRAHERIAHL